MRSTCGSARALAAHALTYTCGPVCACAGHVDRMGLGLGWQGFVRAAGRFPPRAACSALLQDDALSLRALGICHAQGTPKCVLSADISSLEPSRL